MSVRSPIVVVVATRNRSELLRDRCLPSIAAQRRPPDAILVVDDSDSPSTEHNGRVVAEARQSGLAVEYHKMPRPSGAAAAWNHALHLLASRPGSSWVALHDDDDRWTPDHLGRCETAAAAQSANVVVSGIRVVLDGVVIPQPLPSSLIVSDFLRGNPGWQGSNTFLRLEPLLAVGGFDEMLGACLDRDLAIRLLDAGAISIAYTLAHTVDYFVDSNREALSRRGSPEKLAALRRFHAKHGARMSAADRAAFLERAIRLFDASEDSFAERP